MCFGNECPTCHGRGLVKTVETVWRSAREIVRVHHAWRLRSLVYASPAVAEALKGEESRAGGRNLLSANRLKFRSNRFYNREQFDVVMM